MNIKTITKTKNFKQIVIIGFIAASILFWFSMWLYGQFFSSTDDAYINAHVVQIAPRVTGQVNQLFISNNQYIKQGDKLFSIDPVPFQISLKKAQAQLAINQAELNNAEKAASRTLELTRKKYASPQAGDDATTALQTAQAAFNQANATFEQASLDLNWTVISAPTSGWVTNVTLRVGDIIAANQPLFALISDNEFWVDANFKETELEDIKPGQVADIKVDMYPGHAFKGVVESISGGAGAAFSLLPPQNATGNWVKVTQRVPVRIRVLNPDPAFPLRIGSSADVTIHLRKMMSIESSKS